MTTDADRYTYSVSWSEAEQEHVGRCAELPGLSHGDKTPEAALAGIRELVAGVVADMVAKGETPPSVKGERDG